MFLPTMPLADASAAGRPDRYGSGRRAVRPSATGEDRAMLTRARTTWLAEFLFTNTRRNRLRPHSRRCRRPECRPASQLSIACLRCPLAGARLYPPASPTGRAQSRCCGCHKNPKARSMMAGSVNKAIIHRRLGRDPENPSFSHRREVCNLSVGDIRDVEGIRNSGERKVRAQEWHRVTIHAEGLIGIAEPVFCARHSSLS